MHSVDRQRRGRAIGEVGVEVGGPGIWHCHIGHQRTVDEEAHLIVGRVQHIPLDTVDLFAHRYWAKVYALLADVVVNADMEVAVAVEGAEDEVAIAAEILATETHMLPGACAEGRRRLKHAAGEGRLRAHPGAVGIGHRHQAVGEGGCVRAAVPIARRPERSVQRGCIEHVYKLTRQRHRAVADTADDAVVRHHTGRAEIGEGGLCHRAADRGRRGGGRNRRRCRRWNRRSRRRFACRSRRGCGCHTGRKTGADFVDPWRVYAVVGREQQLVLQVLCRCHGVSAGGKRIPRRPTDAIDGGARLDGERCIGRLIRLPRQRLPDVAAPRVEGTACKAAAAAVERGDMHRVHRQRCGGGVGEVDVEVGRADIRHRDIGDKHTVDEEAHLIIGGVQRIPLDAVDARPRRSRPQVDLLLADVVVDAGVEVSVSVEGAEDEVTVAAKVLAGEADVLEGACAKFRRRLNHAAGEGGLRTHPCAVGVAHREQAIGNCRRIGTASPVTRCPASAVKCSAVETIGELTCQRYRAVAHTTGDGVVRHHTGRPEVGEGGVCYKAARRRRRLGGCRRRCIRGCCCGRRRVHGPRGRSCRRRRCRDQRRRRRGWEGGCAKQHAHVVHLRRCDAICRREQELILHVLP